MSLPGVPDFSNPTSMLPSVPGMGTGTGGTGTSNNGLTSFLPGLSGMGGTNVTGMLARDPVAPIDWNALMKNASDWAASGINSNYSKLNVAPYNPANYATTPVQNVLTTSNTPNTQQNLANALTSNQNYGYRNYAVSPHTPAGKWGI